jgi:quinol-cytochrome oxidoreductase complex cytochrome b subunit
MVERARDWLEERIGLSQITAFLAHKTVPVHGLSYWYFLGGITLFLFLVQVGTGMLLLLYYRPTSNEAFESVQYIVTQVRFGWLVRSVHSWSANLMVATAMAHMFSVLFLGAYRKPRELTWVSGMVLLFLILGFGFSGYLLPWNTLSYFATKVGTDMVGQVPLIGKPMMTFLRGGEEVSGATLTRFFGFHVALLPGITTLLIGAHLALIQRQGMSVPRAVEQAWAAEPVRRREMRFFPNFFLREMIAWYIGLALLGALAAFLPWELGSKADPFAPAPAGIKPEWYFLSVFQTLKLIPARIWKIDGELIGIFVFGALALGWTLLPFFEGPGGRGRKFVNGVGVLALSFVVAMTLYGYFAQ